MTIRHLPSGTFQALKYIGGHRYCSTHPTEELARKWIQALEVDVSRAKIGIPAKVQKVGFQPAAQEFCRSYEHRAPNTYQYFAQLFRVFLVPALKGRFLDEITVRDIEDYLQARLRGTGLTNHVLVDRLGRKRRTPRKPTLNSVDKDRTVLVTFFNWAIQREYCATNPAKKVRRLRFSPTRVQRFLSEDELARLFAASEEPLTTILAVGAYTGLRKEEILRLRWKEVDVPRGVIRLQSLAGARETKTKAHRDIPIHPVLRERLETLPHENELLFPSPRRQGGWLDLRGSMGAVCKKAGIEPFRFHDLRHTFASRVLESGADLRTLQELLGHRDIRSTMIYAHLQRDRTRKVIENLPTVSWATQAPPPSPEAGKEPVRTTASADLPPPLVLGPLPSTGDHNLITIGAGKTPLFGLQREIGPEGPISKTLIAIGAAERTRTAKGLLPHAPQTCVSTNSTTAARWRPLRCRKR